jgi:hypothetical protein
MAVAAGGYVVGVDDGIGSGDDESGGAADDATDDGSGVASDDDRTPAARLEDHLDEVTERPEEMQERLDDLGESIDAARRQAQDDDLLPEDADTSPDLPPADQHG